MDARDLGILKQNPALRADPRAFAADEKLAEDGHRAILGALAGDHEIPQRLLDLFCRHRINLAMAPRSRRSKPLTVVEGCRTTRSATERAQHPFENRLEGAGCG